MTVQAGAVLDLQPAPCDVPVHLSVLAKDQLVASVESPFDVAFDGDIGRLQQSLDLGSIGDLDVASHAKLAFGPPTLGQVALVGQFPFQNVVWPHLKPTEPITLRILGSLDRRAFCDCLLYVHELESPPPGLTAPVG